MNRVSKVRALAIVATACVVAIMTSSSARADDDDEVRYGVFRTNASYLPVEQRNCWIQAMISGQTINAERVGERLTSKEARCLLHTEIVGGRCLNMVDSDNADGCG